MGIAETDTIKDAEWCISKLMRLKMWPEREETKGSAWQKNVADLDYSFLVISQFTLHAVFKKPRPDFHKAMGGDRAQQLYDQFVQLLRRTYKNDRVETGAF